MRAFIILLVVFLSVNILAKSKKYQCPLCQNRDKLNSSILAGRCKLCKGRRKVSLERIKSHDSFALLRYKEIKSKTSERVIRKEVVSDEYERLMDIPRNKTMILLTGKNLIIYNPRTRRRYSTSKNNIKRKSANRSKINNRKTKSIFSLK